MSQFIDRFQSEFNKSENTGSSIIDSVPYTKLTGKTKYTITLQSHHSDVVLFTGDPAHNNFGYVYASESSDTIVIKRLVLPVIKKNAQTTTNVINGRISSSATTTLRNTSGDAIDITLSEPDSNIIEENTYIPGDPVHENCKLIAKITTDGIQSVDVTIPVTQSSNNEYVRISDIPVHVENDVIRLNGESTSTTEIRKETRNSGLSLNDDKQLLPIHSVSESTQNNAFEYLLTNFSDFPLHTKETLLSSLSYISTGLINEYSESITRLLYQDHEGEYAQHYGDVVPVTDDTLSVVLEHITKSESLSNTIPPTPIFKTVNDITSLLQQTPTDVDGVDEFIQQIIFPIVEVEIKRFVQAKEQSPVDISVHNDKWMTYDGFQHRVNLALSWLSDQDNIDISDTTVNGLVTMSVTDTPVPEVFVSDLLRGHYDHVITDTAKTTAVNASVEDVEKVIVRHLRGDNETSLDTTISTHARETAEAFESITGKEIIRRNPPTGYASNTQNNAMLSNNQEKEHEDTTHSGGSVDTSSTQVEDVESDEKNEETPSPEPTNSGNDSEDADAEDVDGGDADAEDDAQSGVTLGTFNEE